jgi:MFS family permease
VFGYRRKIYLLGVNAAALPALCWATQIVAPSELFIVLLLTAYAMAISSTLCGAILVENGQKFSASGKFINQEWLWFNVSSIAALLMGGQLVQRLPPTSALHIATGLVALAPSAVIVVTLLLITETKNTINLGELKKSFQGLIAALKTPTLWIVGLFLFFYYFSPGFATPLYYHLTDELRFSQGYIGILGSVASGGWIIGALTYQFFFSRLGLRHLLNLSIFLGTMSSTSYLLLSGEVSAAVLYFCSGFAAMVSLVATLTLAAERCPSRSEGFAFAILLSIINFATTVADLVGSFIYDHVFTRNLAPLILVSATCTAFAFVLVPLLHVVAPILHCPQRKEVRFLLGPLFQIGQKWQSLRFRHSLQYRVDYLPGRLLLRDGRLSLPNAGFYPPIRIFGSTAVLPQHILGNKSVLRSCLIGMEHDDRSGC